MGHQDDYLEAFERGALWALRASLSGFLDVALSTSYAEDAELVECAQHINSAILAIRKLENRLG